MRIHYSIWSILLGLLCNAALANESNAEIENPSDLFKTSWTDNLRWTIDSSTQQWLNSETDQWLDQYVVGLDLHKVISTSQRDIGTLILQPYVVWLPEDRPRPAFFDGNEATLTWRIANFNYIVLPRGRLNVRLGHFEFPFGLEHEINTNGTLRQYSNGANFGAKADWGVSVNGQFPGWQYEAGVTRGTGQEYHSAGNPYAFSGRLGTPFERNLALGLSVFQGRVAYRNGMVDRTRIGTDLRWTHGPLQLMAELSMGKDVDDDVRNWLSEINWTNRQESFLAYVQTQRKTAKSPVQTQSNKSSGFGVRWLLSNRLTLATQFSHATARGAARHNANELRLHFRFRM